MQRKFRQRETSADDFDWTDEECFLRLRSGETPALAVLFERYGQLVRKVARQILRDEQESQDMVQSIFLEIARTADRFDPLKGNARSWILQYAYHRSYNRKKYLTLRGFYRNLALETSEPAVPGAGLCHGLSHAEAARLLNQALDTLGAEHRRVLEKVFFTGKTLREDSLTGHEACKWSWTGGTDASKT